MKKVKGGMWIYLSVSTVSVMDELEGYHNVVSVSTMAKKPQDSRVFCFTCETVELVVTWSNAIGALTQPMHDVSAVHNEPVSTSPLFLTGWFKAKSIDIKPPPCWPYCCYLVLCNFFSVAMGASFAYKNQIVFIGGGSVQDHPKAVFPIYSYHLDKRLFFRVLGNFPHEYYCHTASVVRECVYVIGGKHSRKAPPFESVAIFTLTLLDAKVKYQ